MLYTNPLALTWASFPRTLVS